MSKKQKKRWLRLLALMLAVAALTSAAIADNNDPAELPGDVIDTVPGDAAPAVPAGDDAAGNEPEISEVPEATDEPGNTVAPENTDEPEITDEPGNTEAPETTGAPENTDEPENTGEPEITDEPGNTDEPENTEEPEESEQPEGLPASAVDVTLPYDASFTIMVFDGIGEGIVVSDEYEIVNNGGTIVNIEIVSVMIEIEGVGTYDVLASDELPEEGSAIFAELVCSDADGESRVVLTPYLTECAHTYVLQPGEKGRFSFSGSVSEDAESRWADANVSVKLGFKFA